MKEGEKVFDMLEEDLEERYSHKRINVNARQSNFFLFKVIKHGFI